MSTRRSFLKQAAGVSLAASTLPSSASSYARILGANDRLHVAVMGLGGRGQIAYKSVRSTIVDVVKAGAEVQVM